MECSIKHNHYITEFIIGEKDVFHIRKSINEMHLLKELKKTVIPLNANIIIL